MILTAREARDRLIARVHQLRAENAPRISSPESTSFSGYHIAEAADLAYGDALDLLESQSSERVPVAYLMEPRSGA